MKKAVKIIGIILIPIVAYLAYGFISHLLYLKSLEPGQKLWKDYLAGKDVVDYYENLYTGEMMTKQEYRKFNDSLNTWSVTFKEHDSLKREMVYNTILAALGKRNDSTILSFKYTIRVGNEYLVRDIAYEKIGMQIPEQSFTTITGENIRLGGKQEKPTVINLWFTTCGGCIQEMPVLNAMHKKYGDKVNFVALTFDSEGDVKEFLSKKEFTYQQITEAEDYIKALGTQPYPETIFVNKHGSIEAIEIVDANGDMITASAEENPDFFWAARGGGPGFFGVATRYLPEDDTDFDKPDDAFYAPFMAGMRQIFARRGFSEREVRQVMRDNALGLSVRRPV